MLTPQRYYSARKLMPAWKPEEVTLVDGILPASINYLKGQILGEKVGVDATYVLTITGTPTGGTFTITYGGATTAGIPYNATAAQTQSALNAITSIASNAIQLITLTSATGGTFQIGVLDQITAPIAYNATATAVQTAIAALPNIQTGNVSVSGSAGGPYTVTFNGIFVGAYFPLMSIISAGITPSTATVVPTVVNPGGGASLNVLVTGTQMPGGSQTITFTGTLGKQPITAPTESSAGLTGGSTPTAVITAGVTGVVAVLGVYAAYNIANTDGTATAVGALQFDCATDASGNITFGYQSGGGPWSETYLTAPIYLHGYFSIQDLIGLDNAAVANLGRIVQGSMANGGTLYII